MIALAAFYWYGLLLSFGIGLITGWWVWGQRRMSEPVEFDPYQEVIEWPTVETAPYPPSQPRRQPIMPRMPIREPIEAPDGEPRVEEAAAEEEAVERVAEPDFAGFVQEQADTVDLGQWDVVAASPIVAPAMPEEPTLAPEVSEPTVTPAGPADNLLLIKGVGPGLVRLLNGLGVHRFDDIASWMPEDIEMINSHLGQYRGAIIRDEWIQQARLLALGDIDAFQQRYGHLR